MRQNWTKWPLLATDMPHPSDTTQTCQRLASLSPPQMKDWLMEHGHEKEVWELSSKRGKKEEFQALMRQVTGL